MQRKISPLVVLLLAPALFLYACQPTHFVGTCIPSPVQWEFPVRATITTDLMSDLKQEIPPTGSWQVETALPQEGHIHRLATRLSDEVWVIIDYDLFRYRISTRSWEKFSSVGDFKITSSDLYISSDGTLWVNIDSRNVDDASEFSSLIRYDDTTGRFEFIKDRDNTLSRVKGISFVQKPEINQNRELWMLLFEDIDPEYWYTLISLDTENFLITQYITLKEKQYITEPAGARFSDIAMTPDGRVWIADVGLEQLSYYDPAAGTLNVYQGDPGALDGVFNEDLRGYFNLYVDRMGRLWIDDRGWLDFSNPNIPVWHKVVRSPVFISDAVSPENQFGWSRPDQMYHSSDGRYWFSSAGVGMITLNPGTGEWCKFTTGSSPIAEDNQGNMWIAMFGRLYKYHLAP